MPIYMPMHYALYVDSVQNAGNKIRIPKSKNTET